MRPLKRISSGIEMRIDAYSEIKGSLAIFLLFSPMVPNFKIEFATKNTIRALAIKSGSSAKSLKLKVK